VAETSVDELAAALVVAREQEQRLRALLLTVADAYGRRVASQRRLNPRG
jgi:hypothetical protein